jgi:hypothetical protein
MGVSIPPILLVSGPTTQGGEEDYSRGGSQQFMGRIPILLVVRMRCPPVFPILSHTLRMVATPLLTVRIMAFAALSRLPIIGITVFRSTFMSTFEVGLGIVALASENTSVTIPHAVHDLKMLRVDAGPVPAEVV